ncbi:hypothetical protein RHMOL_Rhmol01G0213600 [Rhododendron molle]|uniref:Uncharacterized protein n=1 Tax=Rhododendron molle TaxID=49168 RepID=A0ACC0Q472_RHOML|nr:hypothetical protein RHMOL_Rhmol01G0213600 [Rhododendron molle]
MKIIQSQSTKKQFVLHYRKIEVKDKWLNKDMQQPQKPREKIRQLVPTAKRKPGKIEGKEKWHNKDKEQPQRERKTSSQVVPMEKKKTKYDAYNFYFLSLPHFKDNLLYMHASWCSFF